MQNGKADNKPTDTTSQGDFGRLMTRAISLGLGLASKHYRTGWQWDDAALADALSLKDGKPIRNWKNGTNLPYKKNLLQFLDLVREHEKYGDEWVSIFERAYEKAKEGTAAKAQLSKSTPRTSGQSLDKLTASLSKLPLISSEEVILVGPSYLDVNIYPVTTTQLSKDVEFSNLDSPRLDLGGSSVFVGRHLSSAHAINAKFITMRGQSDDSFGFLHNELLTAESWPRALMYLEAEKAPPITFLLSHAGSEAKTMLTYPASVERFRWSNIEQYLPTDAKPALLYFSGFTKTSLNQGLALELKKRSAQDFVILDYGKFTPELDGSSMKIEIRRALSLGLVDLNITTFRDFVALYDLTVPKGTDYDLKKRLAIIRNGIAKHGDLGRTVSIIRDYDYEEQDVMLILILGRQVIDLTDKISINSQFHEGFIFAGNDFNAEVIKGLVQVDTDTDTDTSSTEKLEALLIEAANNSMSR